MFKLFKSKLNKQDQEIFYRILYAKANFPSMHVDSQGSLVVDVKEVMASKKFQEKTKAAHKIVNKIK